MNFYWDFWCSKKHEYTTLGEAEIPGFFRWKCIHCEETSILPIPLMQMAPAAQAYCEMGVRTPLGERLRGMYNCVHVEEDCENGSLDTAGTT